MRWGGRRRCCRRWLMATPTGRGGRRGGAPGRGGESLWGWWRETLAPLAPGATEPPRLDLPTDRPWPAVQTWNGDARFFRLDATVAADLGALAHRHGATPFMVLLAGFEAVLARYTGQSDLLIGSPTAGRSAATAGLVGYF